MKARIKFRKYGVMRFIGHLDVMRFFQKAMRRAQIPIAFTEGYSPHMVMSFAQPLGVGLTSDGEYFDIELQESIASDEAVKRLNAVMAEGIDIVSFVSIPDDRKCSGMSIVAAARYEASFLESARSAEATRALPRSCEKKIQEFLGREQILVTKKTKKNEREIDIRPLIYQMTADDTKQKITLLLAAGSEDNLKPELVIRTFLESSGLGDAETPMHYHRVELYAKNPGYERAGGEPFIPLEGLGEPFFEEADTTVFRGGTCAYEQKRAED